MMRRALFRSGTILSISLLHSGVTLSDATTTATGSKLPPLRLEYFDIKAFGEMSRIILKIKDVDFIDDRLPFFGIKDGKAEAPLFQVKKEAGVFGINMGRVPILECKLYCISSLSHSTTSVPWNNYKVYCGCNAMRNRSSMMQYCTVCSAKWCEDRSVTSHRKVPLTQVWPHGHR